MHSFRKIFAKSTYFLIIAGLWAIMSGCAEPVKHHIALPPLAESPSPQTIFGEATLLPDGDPKAALNIAVVDGKHALTLGDCITLARKVSPAIDSADQSYVGSMWSRWQSVTAFLPVAATSYGVTHYDNSLASGNSQSGRDRYTWSLTVSQPIFTGNKNLTNYYLSQLGVSAAAVQKVQAKEDLDLTVKQVYYGILAIEKALAVAKQTVINLRSHLGVAQNFYEVGMVAKNQVLEAEVELAKAIQSETVLIHDLATSKANMNILLRQPLENPVKLVDALIYTPFPLSMDQCLNISLAERPELKLAHTQVEVSAKNIDLARSGYYPQVGLVYTNSSVGSNSGTSGGWGMADPSGWNVAMLASFNFWEWGRTKADVEKSKVELNRSLNALTSLEDSTKLDVTRNYQNLLSAGKNIDVSAKDVVAAAEDLRMVTERYQEQVATNTDVLDSQTRYSQAQYEHYQALYDYNLAWALLERSLGRQVR